MTVGHVRNICTVSPKVFSVVVNVRDTTVSVVDKVVVRNMEDLVSGFI